jgi:hypothetical protein
MNKFEAIVRLKTKIGIEVGYLDRAHRAKLATNQYNNFAAVRGRLISRIGTEWAA